MNYHIYTILLLIYITVGTYCGRRMWLWGKGRTVNQLFRVFICFVAIPFCWPIELLSVFFSKTDYEIYIGNKQGREVKDAS